MSRLQGASVKVIELEKERDRLQHRINALLVKPAPQTTIEEVMEPPGEIQLREAEAREEASRSLARTLEESLVAEEATPLDTAIAPHSTDGNQTEANEPEEVIASAMPEDSKCGRDEQSKMITHCGSPHVVKHGTREGKQRWKCKACGGSYTED